MATAFQPQISLHRKNVIVKLNSQPKSFDELDSVRSLENQNHDVKRRSFFQKSLASTAAISSFPFISPPGALADDSSPLEYFEDSECGFKVLVPKDWDKSTQTLPDRRKIAFFVDPKTADNQDDKTLIFIAYTPIRDDFTSISSFGSVDQVAQMTILPKGKIAMVDDNESKMLSSESKKNAYFFDYTIKAEKQPKRHFRTIFALAVGGTGGAGSVLVTLTAQTSEAKYDEVKDIFDSVIDSYGKL